MSRTPSDDTKEVEQPDAAPQSVVPHPNTTPLNANLSGDDVVALVKVQAEARGANGQNSKFIDYDGWECSIGDITLSVFTLKRGEPRVIDTFVNVTKGTGKSARKVCGVARSKQGDGSLLWELTIFPHTPEKLKALKDKWPVIRGDGGIIYGTHDINPRDVIRALKELVTAFLSIGRGSDED
ncbi:hypothetical protein HON52_02570 [Candidatus Uhrbacteria bacterium]|nr:hypothetical protein [Candidatus Uhrbacteria bacterium]